MRAISRYDDDNHDNDYNCFDDPDYDCPDQHEYEHNDDNEHEQHDDDASVRFVQRSESDCGGERWRGDGHRRSLADMGRQRASAISHHRHSLEARRSQPRKGTVTIVAGDTSEDIVFSVVNDADMEMTETVIITMGTPVNASAAAPSVHNDERGLGQL